MNEFKIPVPTSEEEKLVTLRELEDKYILFVFNGSNQNKRLTAEKLGISLKSVYNRLNRIGVKSNARQSSTTK